MHHLGFFPSSFVHIYISGFITKQGALLNRYRLHEFVQLFLLLTQERCVLDLGCPNRLSSVDRFLDSRCQSRPSCALWRNIFKEAKPTRRPQWGPMIHSTTL